LRNVGLFCSWICLLNWTPSAAHAACCHTRLRRQLFHDLLLHTLLLIPLEAEPWLGGAVEEIECVFLDLLLRRFVLVFQVALSLVRDHFAGFVVIVKDLLGDVYLELVHELGTEQVDILLVELFVDELVQFLRSEGEELHFFLAQQLPVEVALDDIFAQLACSVLVDDTLNDGAESNIVARG
jgi:hypothetical protein